MVAAALMVAALLAIGTAVVIRRAAPLLAPTLERGWQAWIPTWVAGLPGWVPVVASLLVLVALGVVGVMRARSVQCLDVWDSLNASSTSGLVGSLVAVVWAYALTASASVGATAWWGGGFVVATAVGVVGCIAAEELL